MTNYSDSRLSVNPTPFTNPQVGPQAVSAARDPKGRFARPAEPYAVQEVFIPGAWTMGFRVGPKGRIYASRQAAIKFAAHRAAKLSKVSVQAN